MKILHILFAGLCFAGTFTAIADPVTLKSGETIAWSEYQTVRYLGGGQSLHLAVEFTTPETDKALRHQSIIELLRREVVSKATLEGFEQLSILDKKSGGKTKGLAGILSFSFNAAVFENYDFEIGNKWIWEQTGGPELPIAAIQMAKFVPFEGSGFQVSDAIPKIAKDEKTNESFTYYEMYLYSDDDEAPDEGARNAVALFHSLSGCGDYSGVPQSDSMLLTNDALALIVFVMPYQPVSPIQYQPRLKLKFVKTDGAFVCDVRGLLDQIHYGTWEEILASLRTK